MFNLKHKLLIWIMGAFVLIGTVVVELFFWDPANKKAILTSENPIYIIATISFLTIPISAGWLYLMFGKDRLKPRFHGFWTPFGLLLIAWAWLVVFKTDIPDKGLSAGTLLQATPELYRITAFGLLFAFYSLESARPAWYFWWIYILFPLQLVGISGAPPPWIDPVLYATQGFWHSWGYFFVDAYGMAVGAVAMYYIFKWRISVLKKEGERHPRFWGFWECIGLPWVLIARGLKRAFRKKK